MVFWGVNSSIITAVFANKTKRGNNEFIAFLPMRWAIRYICANH